MILLRMFSQGLAATIRSWRAILVLALVSFLCTLPVAILLRDQWDKAVKQSLMPELLMSGFNFTVIVETLAENPGIVQAVVSGTMMMVLLHGLAIAMIGGGLIRAAADAEMPKTVRAILSTGGEYAGRFLRLLLVELFLVVIAGGIVAGIAAFRMRQVVSAAIAETEAFTSIYIFAALALVVMYFITAWADYARLHIVLTDERSAFKAYFRGTKFYLWHIIPAGTMQMILLAIAGALVVIQWRLDDSLVVDSGIMVMATFLIYETLFVFRTAVRIWNYGSAAVLWRSATRLSGAAVPTAGAESPAAAAQPSYVQIIESAPVQAVPPPSVKRRTVARRTRTHQPLRKPRTNRKKRS